MEIYKLNEPISLWFPLIIGGVIDVSLAASAISGISPGGPIIFK